MQQDIISRKTRCSIIAAAARAPRSRREQVKAAQCSTHKRCLLSRKHPKGLLSPRNVPGRRCSEVPGYAA